MDIEERAKEYAKQFFTDVKTLDKREFARYNVVRCDFKAGYAAGAEAKEKEIIEKLEKEMVKIPAKSESIEYQIFNDGKETAFWQVIEIIKTLKQ